MKKFYELNIKNPGYALFPPKAVARILNTDRKEPDLTKREAYRGGGSMHSHINKF